MEIFWTALYSLKRKDFRLIGTTSVWMFFIYGCVVFFEPVCIFLSNMPVILRGVTYTLFIFSFEYFSGLMLKKADICPWDYSDSKYSVNGVIRLDYAPVWFVVGLLYERVFYMLTS